VIYLLFSKFFKFVLIKADGCVSGTVMDVAVVDSFVKTPCKATHEALSSEIIIKLRIYYLNA
jgi:hypothetical protein